jgi:hypothetical protein
MLASAFKKRVEILAYLNIGTLYFVLRVSQGFGF